jgi:PAS domain-containing protein
MERPFQTDQLEEESLYGAAVNISSEKRQLAREIDTYTMENRYVKKDGSLVWTSISVALVWKPDGRPDYFIVVVEDIQTRKRAEEEKFKYEYLFQNASWGMSIASPESRFIKVNEAFAKLHGSKSPVEFVRSSTTF